MVLKRFLYEPLKQLANPFEFTSSLYSVGVLIFCVF